MKLKVTKGAKRLCKHSTMTMMMMNESVIVSSVVCLLWCQYKFILSPLDGLERSEHSMEVDALCPWRSINHCVCLRWS